MRKFALAGILLVLVLALGSCSNSSRGGNFQLYLTDAPIAGLEKVNITISRIEVRKEGEESFSEIALAAPVSVDLLQLRDKEYKLADVNIPEGSYAAIRLTITEVSVVWNGRTFTLNIDPAYEVTVPVAFDVLADGTIKIVLDFQADQSIRGDSILGFSMIPVITVKSIGH